MEHSALNFQYDSAIIAIHYSQWLSKNPAQTVDIFYNIAILKLAVFPTAPPILLRRNKIKKSTRIGTVYA